MPYDPERHHRRSIRLEGFDYSRVGAYFLTICTWQRECLLGEVRDGKTLLTEAGEIAVSHWREIPVRFPTVTLDAFVVMPNHLHGILRITQRAENAPTLGQILRAYKSLSGIAMNRTLGRSERPVWQRNYYERRIPSDTVLEAVRRYIQANPANWDRDDENPANAT
mgnify:FL=1|jgi:Transposase and inactivated derivatives